MAKENRTFLFILVVLAILLANSQGWINLGSLFSAAPGAKVATADQTGTLCLHDGSVMTVGPTQKRYDPATSTAGTYTRVIVDGVDRGLKIDGTTMDVTTPTRIGGTDGSSVELYYAENSSNFYAAKQAFTVPCVNAFSSGARPDSDAYKLVGNASSASITITVFNDDNGLVNAISTSNETIAANDASNMKVKVDWPAKRGFSPYGKILVTVRYNTTVYDGSALTLADGATAFPTTTTPVFRTSASAATGTALKTFELPGYDSMTTVSKEYNLHVESTSTDPKSGAAATGGANLLLVVDDQDWYKNSETGKMEFGAENDQNADVGVTGTISKTIYIA